MKTITMRVTERTFNRLSREAKARNNTPHQRAEQVLSGMLGIAFGGG